MTAVLCRNAADRSAATWHAQLARLDRLEFVASDAASGIAAAVVQLATARVAAATDPTATVAPAATATPLEHGLDLFHTAREAKSVLARQWRAAEAAWHKAEAIDAAVAASKLAGIDARGRAQRARAAWGRAVAALERAERHEAAWARARSGFDLFDDEGRLNDRARAEAEIAVATRGLAGPEWSKVRRALADPRSLASLDRVHRGLESAEPRPGWREAMAWRWWLDRHRPRTSSGLLGLLRETARSRELDPEERSSYERVAAVLSGATRASSAVECLNGVLRMQQSRHKRMTQAMLDLKRLYWNCQVSRAGPRRGSCPYQRLGLELPTFDFWGLLRTDPAELAQRLSTAKNAE